MRPTPILLTLAIGLGFVHEAGAESGEGQHHSVYLPPYQTPPPTLTHDYTLHISGHLFGIKEWQVNGRPYTALYVGPFADFEVPFTATQGLVGFFLVLTILILLPAVLTVRRKRQRAT
jgi:hypothetical protein